jgi:hypothetical protein
MRGGKLGSICAAILLGCCIAGTALAQGQPGGAGAGGGRRQGRGGGQGRGQFGRGGQLSLATVSADVLGSELSLNDDQKTKIKAIQEQTQKDLAALRPQAGAPAGNPQETAQKRRDINTKATADINAVLTDDQKTKSGPLLKKLSAVQSVGIPVGVYGELKLTDDQVTKLTELSAEVTKERTQKLADAQAARQAGDTAKAQEIQASLRTTGPNEKAKAILTDAQKASVEKWMKDHPAPQGRRRNAQPNP